MCCARHVTTLVQRLGTLTARLRFADLPPEVQEEAKRRLLDFLAVTLPAFDRAEAARAAAAHAGTGGSATIVSAGTRAPAALAAFANGVAGACLELDDDHAARVGHVGTPTVPAALAVAEAEGASGADLLAAVVAGYEAYVRVARGVRTGALLGKGFQPSGVAGAFGAAAAASRAMGLDAQQSAHALALAASQSAGLIEGTDEGAWTKRFNPGWAAHCGVHAAQLARLGFTGASTALEGRRGWYAAYAGADARAAEAFADLGERFEILGSVTKPYACSRYCHAAVDAAIALRAGLPADPEALVAAVQRIEVETFAHGLGFVAEPAAAKRRPVTVVDAQFSMFHAVAVALLDGAALLDQFTAERVADPHVRALAAAVDVVAVPDLEALYPRRYPARVRVRLRDGRVLEETVESPTSDPGREFTPTQFDERFRALAGLALPANAVAELRAVVERLERLPDLRPLTSLVAGGIVTAR
jgi:2-methylcitrate dehydratase PrpD